MAVEKSGGGLWSRLPGKDEWLAGVTLAGALPAGLVLVPGLLFQAGLDFMAAYAALGLVSLAGTAWLASRGLPYVAFPSVGIAGWLVYLVIISRGFSWQQVMGLAAAVSLSGAFLFASRLGAKVPEAVPDVLRWALQPALGLMLVLLGLVKGRIVIASPWSVTMLGNFQDPLAYLGLTGLVLGMMLLALRVRSFLGWTFLVTALLAFLEGFWALPAAPVILPEGLDKSFGQAALTGAAVEMKPLEYLGTGLALFLLVNCHSYASLQALGESERAPGLLAGMAGFSFLGAFLGCLPLTVSPVSAIAGAAGLRGGRVAAAAAALLAVLLFFEPVAAAMAKFPAMAVPVLVLAGLHLLRESWLNMPWTPGRAIPLEEFLPAACVIVLLPLSWNAAAAIGAGLLSWVLMLSLAGRRGEIAPPARGLALCFLAYFLFGDI